MSCLLQIFLGHWVEYCVCDLYNWCFYLYLYGCLWYYCRHYRCSLGFTFSSYEYLGCCCKLVPLTLMGFTILQIVLIYFVAREIKCKISISRSSQEWDESFEYLVNMTLGLMALELGHQYLNRMAISISTALIVCLCIH